MVSDLVQLPDDPGQIPKQPDLTRWLISQTGASVEVIIRGRFRKSVFIKYIDKVYCQEPSVWLVTDESNRNRRRHYFGKT